MLKNMNDKKQEVEDNMDTLVNKFDAVHPKEDECTKLHTQELYPTTPPPDSTDILLATSHRIDEEDMCDDEVVTAELSKHEVGFVKPDTEVNYGKPEQKCLFYTSV